MDEIQIFLVPADELGGKRAQRNDREPLRAREFDSGSHQRTADAMPCEFAGDFRVDQDKPSRQAPIGEEGGLAASVRLEAAGRLVVRDIQARVRFDAHGPGGRVARGK